MKTYNYYKDFITGNIVRYLMNSVFDTPEEREKRSELDFREKYCQITSCKIYDSCDKIQVKGNNKKCKNYESILKA